MESTEKQSYKYCTNLLLSTCADEVDSVNILESEEMKYCDEQENNQRQLSLTGHVQMSSSKDEEDDVKADESDNNQSTTSLTGDVQMKPNDNYNFS